MLPRKGQQGMIPGYSQQCGQTGVLVVPVEQVCMGHHNPLGKHKVI